MIAPATMDALADVARALGFELREHLVCADISGMIRASSARTDPSTLDRRSRQPIRNAEHSRAVPSNAIWPLIAAPTSARATSVRPRVPRARGSDGPPRRTPSLLRCADEALSPGNARRFDGDDNHKKRVVVTVCVVGESDGSPVFVLDAKCPRSAVNDLALSSHWETNDRAEAINFLRQLIDKIERSREPPSQESSP